MNAIIINDRQIADSRRNGLNKIHGVARYSINRPRLSRGYDIKY